MREQGQTGRFFKILGRREVLALAFEAVALPAPPATGD
jgi:hypothetical protein